MKKSHKFFDYLFYAIKIFLLLVGLINGTELLVTFIQTNFEPNNEINVWLYFIHNVLQPLALFCILHKLSRLVKNQRELMQCIEKFMDKLEQLSFGSKKNSDENK